MNIHRPTLLIALLCLAALVALSPGLLFATPQRSPAQDPGQLYLPLAARPLPTSTPTLTPTLLPTLTATLTAEPSATLTPLPPTLTPRTGNCDPSYPTVCIPPPPPDLDCADIPYRGFEVRPPDPHQFDGDKDGVGCVYRP